MFLAAYLVFLCTRGWAKDVPIEEIASKMEQDKTITSLEKCGARQLRRFYGLEAGNLEGYVFYKAESPMSVDEFLVVKAESPKEAEDVLDSAEKHLEEQKKSFEGYGCLLYTAHLKWQTICDRCINKRAAKAYGSHNKKYRFISPHVACGGIFCLLYYG